MLYKHKHCINNVTFIHFGNSTLLYEIEYNPKKDFKFNKPINTLWSSPYTSDKSFKSEWEKYCIENSMNDKVEDYTLFRLKSNARILVIDSLSDLFSLDDKYINKYLINDNIVTDDVLIIDTIKEDFDGIFLTSNGKKECSNIFYKWEVESLSIFSMNVIVKLYKEIDPL